MNNDIDAQTQGIIEAERKCALTPEEVFAQYQVIQSRPLAPVQKAEVAKYDPLPLIRVVRGVAIVGSVVVSGYVLVSGIMIAVSAVLSWVATNALAIGGGIFGVTTIFLYSIARREPNGSNYSSSSHTQQYSGPQNININISNSGSVTQNK